MATQPPLAAPLQGTLTPPPFQAPANGNGNGNGIAKQQTGWPSLDETAPKSGGKKRIVVLGSGERSVALGSRWVASQLSGMGRQMQHVMVISKQCAVGCWRS